MCIRDRARETQAVAEVKQLAIAIGDEVREYLQSLAASSVSTNNDEKEAMLELVTSMRDQLKSKGAQIATLTAQVTALTTSIETLNKTIQCMLAPSNPTYCTNGGKERGKKQKAEDKPLCSMGSWCWTHGWDPYGVGHNSKCAGPRPYISKALPYP